MSTAAAVEPPREAAFRLLKSNAMCGIVGLLAKSERAQQELGRWLTPMFTCMAARGPDSGGLAVFHDPVDMPWRRYSVYANDRQYDWSSIETSLHNDWNGDGGRGDSGNGDSGNGARLWSIENHAVVTVALDREPFENWLGQIDATLHLLSAGRSLDVYKDQGQPAEIARRYQFTSLTGSHCVGHTRMATESAVTPAHSHPFTAGEDFCLVHNGSLSNPYMLRRMLERHGLRFDTDNDTEAACRYIEWRLQSGSDLDGALQLAFRDLDGFYTLLMATDRQLTLVRDAFACKPAVVAETDEYVAVGSEFRSLAHLPGIDEAHLFEPAPEEIYSWQL